MNTQIKDIGQMLLLIIPVCIGFYFYWINCPMYQDIKAQQRASIQSYLQRTYYSIIPGEDREKMMSDHNLTDEDIDPEKFLQKVFAND